jgi:outer membrane murein-binding lipoprotein Lpp
MSEQKREQNKKINQHSRQITDLETRLKTLELDVEPRGRISLAFDAVEEDLDEIKSSINQLDRKVERLEQSSEHQFNQLNAKLEILISHLRGVNDLPEE